MEIDINLGKLPQKEKGSLELIECKTVEEKRRHGLERLASGFRTFSHFGFDEGVAGHITFRDPEFEHHFWVNPFGMHFGQICVSDLVLVDRNGEVVLGDRPVNTAAFGFVFPNLTSFLLGDLGLTWREAYLLFGVLIILINVPVVYLFIVNKPSDINQMPDGEEITDNAEDTLGIDWTIPELLKDRNFWILSLVFAIQFCSMMGILSQWLN